MKKVITFGVFDYFHYGHLRLFEQAKINGDYLIVAIQDEAYIRKYKPDAKIFYTNEQRNALIRALRIVDETVFYTDVDVTIKEIDFDVFAVGEDQNHAGFQSAIRYCEENQKSVVRMTRTPGICSSEIKNHLSS